MTTGGSMNGTAPLLQVDAVSVRYGGVLAVDEVTFQIREGGFHGLIGPNGAGKTSLIDALSGYTRCSGDVRFRGAAVGDLKIFERARLGMVRTFQSLELFDDLTVEENVMVGCDQRDGWAIVREVARGGTGPADPRVRRLLEDFGIADVSQRRVFELSHGERKMVMLARALASQPQLLILDEPAAGLDNRESAELGGRLSGINDQGVTILMIEHDMTLVMGLCREITVLDFGKVIAQGRPAEIQADPIVVQAYLGSPAVHDAPSQGEARG